MAFTPKNWVNSPSTDTPISAAALSDLEERVTDYSESVAAAGVQLDRASITSDATRASTTFADISGLSVTVDVGARPVEIKFSAGAISNNAANAGVAVKILRGTSFVGGFQTFFTSANVAIPVTRIVSDSPAAGNYTYKAQLATVFSGTATVKADSATSYGPASLSVVEV